MNEFKINGVDLHLPPGLATPEIRQKLTDGTYEADEARAADRCVKPGFRVLELGAGIGYVTALCAQRTDPECVLSVEANPALIPVIEANLKRNGIAGVSLLHGAVAGAAGEGAMVPFNLSAGYTGSSLSGRGGAAVSVPLIGITDLIRAHRPHVVLMDIEGAEAELFDRRWRCPLRYFVLELHPRKYHPRVIKRIVDFMSRMDMTYDPVTSNRKILGFRKVWDDGSGDPET